MLKSAARRMGGRAVKCTGLENRRRCKPSVGSNPTPSASEQVAPCPALHFSVQMASTKSLIAVLSAPTLGIAAACPQPGPAP